MHYALFLQILYFEILSCHPIFRYTYIFHDRFLKVEFVKKTYLIFQNIDIGKKNTLILCKMTSQYDRTRERSAKCYRLKIQWSTTSRATTTATKKKSRPRVTVASNMFHPRPNTLRPIEAKTQSIVRELARGLAKKGVVRLRSDHKKITCVEYLIRYISSSA